MNQSTKLLCACLIVLLGSAESVGQDAQEPYDVHDAYRHMTVITERLNPVRPTSNIIEVDAAIQLEINQILKTVDEQLGPAISLVGGEIAKDKAWSDPDRVKVFDNMILELKALDTRLTTELLTPVQLKIVNESAVASAIERSDGDASEVLLLYYPELLRLSKEQRRKVSSIQMSNLHKLEKDRNKFEKELLKIQKEDLENVRMELNSEQNTKLTRFIEIVREPLLKKQEKASNDEK